MNIYEYKKFKQSNLNATQKICHDFIEIHIYFIQFKK